MATGSDHAKAEPIATTAEQEYLESLFWLFEAGFPMTGANLSRAMQLSAPTVHEMLRRLERDGYIHRGGGGREIEFTDSGREHAERVVGRHRMIERFLTDVVGVPWDDVHEEAEKLEHAMTPRFEAYVRDAVGDAKTCPHGHPIQVGSRVDGVPLADCQPGAKVTILRFENEAEDLLHYLMDAGIEPGVEGEIAANDGARAPARDRAGHQRADLQRRRDRLGQGRPVAAAAQGAARAARARPRALRPLSQAGQRRAKPASDGRRRRPDLGVRLGQQLDSGLDLLWGNARVGQPQ